MGLLGNQDALYNTMTYRRRLKGMYITIYTTLLIFDLTNTSNSKIGNGHKSKSIVTSQGAPDWWVFGGQVKQRYK